MTQAAVFLGPSMALDAARQILDATYLPPVRQGDVYRVLREQRPSVIGIVDGFFHQVPSVWHREILWALSQGVHVLGAASMGALRAAELHSFGMRGIGAIFAAYRDGAFQPYGDPFEDDDEVAVVHGPAETGFVGVSEAMADIRDNLARAAAAGAVTADMRDTLAAIGKAMPYRERSLARILDEARAQAIRPAEIDALAAWLKDNQASCKSRDTAALLHEVRRLLAGPPEPFRPNFRFEQASIWSRFVERAETSAALSDLDAAVLDELKLLPREWRTVQRQAVLRCAAGDRARSLGLAPTDEAGRAAFDRLRRAAELPTREALLSWVAANGLDEAGLARLVREEARFDLIQDHVVADIERAAADHLRLEGRFAALAARALAKRRWAEQTGIAGRHPAAPEIGELVVWFVETRLNERFDMPRVEDLAAAQGFRDAASFLRALRLERMYSLANPTPDAAEEAPTTGARR